MAAAEEAETVQRCFRLRPDQAEWLRARAEKEDRSPSASMRVLIDQVIHMEGEAP